MDVPLALLADYANVSQEGKLNVLGIFGRINASNFPCTHGQMYVVLKLEATPAEYERDASLEVAVVDDDGEKVGGFALPLHVPRGPGRGKVAAINQIIRVDQMRFEKPGDYAFHILIDKDAKATIPLELVKIDSGGIVDEPAIDSGSDDPT